MSPAHAPGTRLAVVDLGSNSFEMRLARLEQGHLTLLESHDVRVTLAEGLAAHGEISADAWRRASEVLDDFGHSLRLLPDEHVRAVGTSTLRRASNASAFLRQAEALLGHSIEIIGGQEEAQLTYLGVCAPLDALPPRRLVIDIGGSSTEVIAGQGGDALRRASIEIGCVTFSERFFPTGRVSATNMTKARAEATQALQRSLRPFETVEWDLCLGSSGTIRAVDQMGRINAWSEGGITPEVLTSLRGALIEAADMRQASIPGLTAARSHVIAGGVAILSALFDLLEVKEMQASQAALCEGLLAELSARLKGHLSPSQS